jgi:hypothetical protein
MDGAALYDEDMHAWALHQAAVLRRVARAGLPLPNDLDLEHVAEEIEDLGNEQRFQVESNVERAIEHLLKVALRPDDPAAAHWLKEAAAFLDTAHRRYRRSMRRVIEPEALWRTGCRRVMLEFGYGRADPVPLPAAMPFAFDDLVAPETDPRDLVAALAAALPKLG